MTRFVLETVVRKALNEFPADPRASLRKLALFGVLYSETDRERFFWHALLERTRSGTIRHIQVISDVLAQVDRDTLVTFLLNLFYNTCAVGAKTIHSLSRQKNLQIPWIMALDLDADRLSADPRAYDCAVAQGMALGTYAYLVSVHGQASAALPLLRRYPDCAFVLYCRPGDVTLELLNGLKPLHHVMLSVSLEEGSGTICRLLREMRCLYSVHLRYQTDEVASILDGSVLTRSNRAKAAITLLTPGLDCSLEDRRAVYAYIRRLREHCGAYSVWVELFRDSGFVSRVLSSARAVVSVHPNGQLSLDETILSGEEYNLFQTPLAEILQRALPLSERAEAAV